MAPVRLGREPAGGMDRRTVCDVLVIEGCCVGVPPVAAYLSFLVWLDTPAHDRRRRLEAREDWVHYAPHFDGWSQQESALQDGAGT